MHVGAINNYSFTSRQHRTSPRDSQGKINRADNPQPPEVPSETSNGAKAAMYLLMATPIALGVQSGLGGCTKILNYDIDMNCCCDTCPQPSVVPGDTIYWHDTIPVPGSTDTVYITPDYESPVIDTTNSILNNLGITPGDGVPVKFTYIDELNTKHVKMLFNNKSSSENVVVYDVYNHAWDDYNGTFIMDDNLAEKAKVRLTLASDGGLYAQYLVPKVSNPQSMADYKPINVAYKLMNADAGNVMVWREDNQSGDFVHDGVVEKGATQNSIQITNGFNTSWRWTDIVGDWMVVPKGKGNN